MIKITILLLPPSPYLANYHISSAFTANRSISMTG
jgi:hypothetical protein